MRWAVHAGTIFGRTWVRWAGLLLVFLFAMAGSSVAWAAAPKSDCSTPRKALDTWLGNSQPTQDHPEVAISCFDWSSAGTPPKERPVVAKKLKKVLDGQGLWVELDAISDDPDLADARVVPFPNAFETFYLEKKGGRWLISSATIDVTPTVYGETYAFNTEALLSRLPDQLSFLTEELAGIAYWQMLGFLLLIIVGLIIRSIATYLMTSWGVRLLERIGFVAGSKTVRSAAKPIGTLVMAGLLWYLFPALGLSAGTNKVLVVALRVMAALMMVMVLYRIVDVIAEVFEKRAELTETKLDDQLVPLIRKSVKVFVAAIGFIFVLQNMDIDVASLLAGASLGGLAFTLAARDTVANLFGSLSIFADRPFQIGDWVVVAGGAEGVVEEVGMRTTRIRTFYDSMVTVPNSKIADGVVDNYGARTYRRAFTTLGVTYDTSPDQIQAFCEGIRAILQNNESVRKDAYEVVFSGFGDSSLEIMVYFFFKVDTWSEELIERHNVYLEILRLAKELDVEFAFPTQTLHVASQVERRPMPQPKGLDIDALRKAVEGFGPKGALARPSGPKITKGYFAEPMEKGGDTDDQ